MSRALFTPRQKPGSDPAGPTPFSVLGRTLRKRPDKYGRQRDYQMITRSFGGRYILSPSLTLKAS
jgi:hypothetical protein